MKMLLIHFLLLLIPMKSLAEADDLNFNIALLDIAKCDTGERHTYILLNQAASNNLREFTRNNVGKTIVVIVNDEHFSRFTVWSEIESGVVRGAKLESLNCMGPAK